VSDTEEILEVGAFYQLLTARLESAYGRRHPHWVRGEIARSTRRVTSTSTSWTPVPRPQTPSVPCSTRTAGDAVGAPETKARRRRRDAVGGLIVNFYGYVDVYAPQGKIGFTITQIDVQGLLVTLRAVERN